MNHDPELDDLIRATHPKPAFEPSFQREIWARISVNEEGHGTGAASWISTLFGAFSRPVPVAGAAVALALLGVGLERSISNSSGRDYAQDAYLESINPLVISSARQ